MPGYLHPKGGWGGQAGGKGIFTPRGSFSNDLYLIPHPSLSEER